MTEISSLLLLGLGEILLVTTVISAVLIFVSISRKSRDQTAAKVLISRIKEDAQRRLSETQKIMEGQFGIVDEELKEIVAKVSREEKVFYQHVINMYLKRDHKSLENLNVDFEGAVETYRTLEIPDRNDAESGTSEEETEERAMLEAEVDALKSELKITMNTMGNMLSEYAAIFSGEAPTGMTAPDEEPAAEVSEDLMNIDDEAVNDALMELGAEELADADGTADDELLDIDEEESADDELLDLDEEESAGDELMDLDSEELADDEFESLDESDLDEDLEDLSDVDGDELLDLDSLEDDADDIVFDSIDGDTQPSPSDEPATGPADDPDQLLDQIRAEDKLDQDKG